MQIFVRRAAAICFLAGGLRAPWVTPVSSRKGTRAISPRPQEKLAIGLEAHSLLSLSNLVLLIFAKLSHLRIELKVTRIPSTFRRTFRRLSRIAPR